jgi:peptidoglycan hydrolase-like protein with peptidoglycan-binding domain
VPRKSKKSARVEYDGELLDLVQAPARMSLRAILLGSGFCILCAMVLYNAFALQPVTRQAQLAADNAIYLHFDPVVEEIQRQLLDTGYFKGLVDGVNGEKTKAAIISYQAASGLSADGVASQSILDHLKLEKKIVDASRFTASTDKASTGTAKRNEVEQNLFLVQSALADLGYDPGNMTGGMTDATRAAIRRFETDRHLLVTGEINASLLTELAKTTGYESLAN